MLSRALFLIMLVAGSAASALAQAPPPAASTPPGLSALPKAPADTRLPGPDPRECGLSNFSALCADGRWAQYSTMKLRVSAPSFSGTYAIEQAANNELHATYLELAGGQRRGGEVVLFNDAFAYRTRETFPDNGSILELMMASPIMLTRLTAVLLDEAILGPPADVTSPRTVKAESKTRFIRTPAGGMAALYAPPWSVTGTVRPAGGGEIAFSLSLRYRPVDERGRALAGKTDTITLQGVASYAPMREALPETFDLVGWKLLRNEQPLPGVATLAEARRAAPP